jgi:guanine nucleotide-binding protein subunit beta-2-like 1 protein
MANNSNCSIKFEGFLYGHNGLVTSLVSGNSTGTAQGEILVSGSRDKTLIIWNLNEKEEGVTYGVPFRSLTGHNNFVSDLTISNDNFYVISSSWDKTMRLWDIRYGTCLKRFASQASTDKEIHSLTFYNCNRQIISGGSSKDLRIWNTVGQCKVKNDKNNHNGWVSKVRYSSSTKNPYFASVGRDGRLKIWNQLFRLYASIKAHENYINALAISTNSRYLATGGRDQEVKIWDYANLAEAHATYKVESEVYDLAFNNQFEWLAVALDGQIAIYDINNKERPISVQKLEHAPGRRETDKLPKATSLKWSTDSQKLYVGGSDGNIRVYSIEVTQN